MIITHVKVCEEIRKHGPSTAKDLAAHLGCHGRAVSNALIPLIRRGMLHRYTKRIIRGRTYASVYVYYFDSPGFKPPENSLSDRHEYKPSPWDFVANRAASHIRHGNREAALDVLMHTLGWDQHKAETAMRVLGWWIRVGDKRKRAT